MNPDDQMSTFITAMRWIGLAFAVFIGVLLCGIFVVVLRVVLSVFGDLLRPTRWPTTHGRVVASEVQAEGGNFPQIVYEYEVDGEPYSGERVTFEPRRRNDRISEYPSRYPMGKSVLVHYDPADPSNSVLEVAPVIFTILRLGFTLVLTVLVFAFIGMVSFGSSVLDRIPEIVTKIFEPLVPLIERHFPQADAWVVITGGAIALFLALFGTVLLWPVLQRRLWPVATGVVISSEVKLIEAGDLELRDHDGGHRANVTYVYEVEGHRYHSDQINMVVSYGSWLDAQRIVVRYPVGKTVEVRYNPENPAHSVLETSGLWLPSFVIFLFAGLMLWIAVAASGYFNSSR